MSNFEGSLVVTFNKNQLVFLVGRSKLKNSNEIIRKILSETSQDFIGVVVPEYLISRYLPIGKSEASHIKRIITRRRRTVELYHLSLVDSSFNLWMEKKGNSFSIIGGITVPKSETIYFVDYSGIAEENLAALEEEKKAIVDRDYIVELYHHQRIVEEIARETGREFYLWVGLEKFIKTLSQLDTSVSIYKYVLKNDLIVWEIKTQETAYVLFKIRTVVLEELDDE